VLDRASSCREWRADPGLWAAQLAPCEEGSVGTDRAGEPARPDRVDTKRRSPATDRSVASTLMRLQATAGNQAVVAQIEAQRASDRRRPADVPAPTARTVSRWPWSKKSKPAVVSGPTGGRAMTAAEQRGVPSHAELTRPAPTSVEPPRGFDSGSPKRDQEINGFSAEESFQTDFEFRLLIEKADVSGPEAARGARGQAEGRRAGASVLASRRCAGRRL
jgi:hypothetical protein